VTLICKYPVMQVRPYGLLVYEHKEFSSNRAFKRDRPERDFKPYTGAITEYSSKKLKRAIGLMVASAKEKDAPNFKTGNTFKFKVNFITFTLPALAEGIEDGTIKRCLDNWVKRAKRKYDLKSYVWRAERQLNHNIHFHMITDCWIHYEKIRNDWNAVLRETGLIDKFKEKYGHENPNSTDVHAVWKVKNLTQYFVKYMTKNTTQTKTKGKIKSLKHLPEHYTTAIFKVPYTQDHNTKKFHYIKGKVWDCSKNLKTKNNCWMLLEGIQAENFDTLANREDVERINDPNFTILFVPIDKWNEYLCKEVREKWDKYLEDIRNWKEPPDKEPERDG
jgi:hypothetical protein